MLVHVVLTIFLASALNGLARRARKISTISVQSSQQSKEVKGRANGTQSHRVGNMVANRYILVQELEDRRHGHGRPTRLKHEYNYEENAKLGEGGFARAYKATDMNGNKDVVLKILKEEFADQHAAQQQTSDECNFMQALQSEDLVKIFPDGARNLMHCSRNNIKVGKMGLGHNQFIVLEYGGIPLDEEPKLGLDAGDVKNRGKRIVEVVNQTLRGLVYLAGLGVSHRDLSPDNILVQYNEDGTAKVKIIDFGSMAYGSDVHCGGSVCKELGHSVFHVNRVVDCPSDENGRASCDFPGFAFPSDSCSFEWEDDAFAPPEMRHKAQRVCLTPNYPVDMFDIWSLGMTAVQLVNARFGEDCGVGDGFKGNAPNSWRERFWTNTSLDSSSDGLLSEFCTSALQWSYNTRGRLQEYNVDQLGVVDLLKIFDAKFERPNFPKLSERLFPISVDVAREPLKMLSLTPRNSAS